METAPEYKKAMIIDYKHTATYAYGVWKIDETDSILLSMLDQKEWYQPYLESVSSSNRRQEWLACRVLLKELLGYEVEVKYRPSGAPYLSEDNKRISFSHTKGYVAVQVTTANQHLAAIDIEYTSERIKKIKHRFMNEAEEESLDRANETQHLLLHWCAKETLYKLIDRKDIEFRDHLHVCPFPLASSGSLGVYETRTEKAAAFTLKYELTAAYALTYAI